MSIRSSWVYRDPQNHARWRRFSKCGGAPRFIAKIQIWISPQLRSCKSIIECDEWTEKFAVERSRFINQRKSNSCQLLLSATVTIESAVFSGNEKMSTGPPPTKPIHLQGGRSAVKTTSCRSVNFVTKWYRQHLQFSPRSCRVIAKITEPEILV